MLGVARGGGRLTLTAPPQRPAAISARKGVIEDGPIMCDEEGRRRPPSGNSCTAFTSAHDAAGPTASIPARGAIITAGWTSLEVIVVAERYPGVTRPKPGPLPRPPLVTGHAKAFLVQAVIVLKRASQGPPETLSPPTRATACGGASLVSARAAVPPAGVVMGTEGAFVIPAAQAGRALILVTARKVVSAIAAHSGGSARAPLGHGVIKERWCPGRLRQGARRDS